MELDYRSSAGVSRPRVVLLGSAWDALRSPSDGLVEALEREADCIHVEAHALVLESCSAYFRTAAAIAHGAELIHVLDARFIPIAAILRRRLGVLTTATVSAGDLSSRSPWSVVSRHLLADLDAAFTSEESALYRMRETMPWLATTLVRPTASPLPPARSKDTEAVAKALRGVRPGRLVLGLLWPENRNDLRWFRDVVLPQLDGKPMCLLLGAPSQREARLLTGAGGRSSQFRVLRGSLDAPLIAAVAPAVDAFVSAASLRYSKADAVTPLALSLAVSGVPMVTDGEAGGAVLAHEQNALLVDRDDERGFASTINRLLALPAIQRHFLGEEFGRFTLERWPWRDAAEVYGERFAALVGRPRIPSELRAA